MKTILIVDDEPDLREALRAILEIEGYRVVDCADGHEARMKVFEDPPDLIISDISMPQMDGWSLVQEIRSLPLTRFTPFLFLTGVANAATHDEAMRSGADGVLTKPIDGSTLLGNVKAQLDRYETIRQESDQASEGLRTALSLALPHGLNTSLHLIAGYTSLLSAQLGSGRSDLRSYIVKIEEASQRLQSTLQKLWLLLEVEELASRRPANVPEVGDTCHLAPVLRSVALDVGSTFHRSIEMPNELPDAHLRVSERLAANLFRELIQNAILFSPQDTPVIVSVDNSGVGCSVTIQDRGRGLSASPVSGLQAFGEFQRRRFELKGHGLGLAIIDRILRFCHGDVRIESERGAGSCVTVTLPRIKAG